MSSPARRLAAVLALPLALSLTACHLDFGGTFGTGPRVNGSGLLAHVERATPDYRRLVIKVPADTTVRVGEGPYLRISGDDNLLSYLTTEVDGDTLTIGMQRGNSYRFEEDLTIDVGSPDLEALTVSGSGDARVTGVTGPSFEARVSGSGELDVQGEADHLDAHVSGSGDVRLDFVARDMSLSISGSGDFRGSGRADRMEASISGSGDMDLSRLEVREASLRISGSGDMDVHVTDRLDVRVSGSGDVSYRGRPTIEKRIRGSGDLHAVDY